MYICVVVLYMYVVVSANFSNAPADASLYSLVHTAVENFSQVTGGSVSYSKPKTLTIIIITKLKIKHKRNYSRY